jgi:hypothetical protein
MSDDRIPPLKRRLFDEIWEEISSLQGKELDAYLAEIGLAPEKLLLDYAKAMDGVFAAAKRARFEEARRHVRQQKSAHLSKIRSLDVGKKREILAAIRDYAARTKDMTIAARNQRIEDERDIDSFLEACFLLGMIDSEGNLTG